MEKLLINDEIKHLLTCSNKFEWNQIFIKRVSHAVHFDSLEIMEKNKEKLREEWYAFVNRVYHDSDEQKIAIGSDFCTKYQTFYEFFTQEKKGKEQVVLEILEAVSALDTLGLDYWDIHPFNILVNKEGHIKLVDLDSTKVRKYNEEYRLCGFIDMIIESYFFFDMKGYQSAKITDFGLDLSNLVSLSQYYSPAVVQLIQGKYQNSSILKNVEKVLKELEDQEKIVEIRKQVKELRPYWFK